jgi:hypothetical protein
VNKFEHEMINIINAEAAEALALVLFIIAQPIVHRSAPGL